MGDNILARTTDLAKVICEKYADKGKTAVDATCGNGHDTVWLAERFGSVYAFDVQKSAAEATSRLAENRGFNNVTVICDSHENMGRYVKETVRLVMFNLGYLPGGDKNIVTESHATLKAVDGALSLLEKDGMICIIMYPGHWQGAGEKEALLQMASKLDKSKYHCVCTDMINQPAGAPEILFITLKT